MRRCVLHGAPQEGGRGGACAGLRFLEQPDHYQHALRKPAQGMRGFRDESTRVVSSCLGPELKFINLKFWIMNRVLRVGVLPRDGAIPSGTGKSESSSHSFFITRPGYEDRRVCH